MPAIQLLDLTELVALSPTKHIFNGLLVVDCSQIEALLDAWVDGELSPAEATVVDAHLEQCDTCRATADATRALDGGLRAAFAPHRETALAVAQRASPAPGGGVAGGAWGPLLLAAAAGFLLAVFIFRPWEREETADLAIAAPPPFAHLAVATGPVEVLPPGGITWYTCPSSAPIETGARVRTGSELRCELLTDDGTAIRLNSDTEVALPPGERIQLDRGRLWLRVDERAGPLTVDTPQMTVRAEQATLDVRATDEESELLVVDGEAAMESRAGDAATVTAGRAVLVRDGRIARQYALGDPIVATRWVHDILVRKGNDDPELAARIERMWAQVGRAKLAHLYEEEMRALGGSSARPLSSYLLSAESRSEPHRRLQAARILSDVAQPDSIPTLIGLLADADGEVRMFSARALERLTGQNFGRPPDAWSASPWTSCEPTHQAWQKWWGASRDRYPGAGEIPQVTPPTGEAPERALPAEGTSPDGRPPDDASPPGARSKLKASQAEADEPQTT